MPRISKKTTKTKPAKKPKTAATPLPARRYKSFRLEKRIKHTTGNRLSSSFRLFLDSLSLVRQHWRVFGGIAAIYIMLNILLIGSANGFNMDELKDGLLDDYGNVGASLFLFGSLASSAGGTSSEAGSIYQPIVILVVSLAIVWTLRRLLAGEKVSVRDAFYKGMYPLIPVILVLLVVGLQLVPLLLGGFLYSTVFGNGLAVTAIEQLLWALLLFLLSVLSLYMVTSSLFALYVATLVDVRPMAALHSGRKLVRYRRWTIMRKLLFLPAAFLLIGAIILIPLIMWIPLLVQVVFMMLGALGLVVAHTYVYSLYRELL